MNTVSAPPPSSRFGVFALVLVAVLSAAIAAAGAFFVLRQPATSAVASPHDEAQASLYQCPMHPAVIQDHPGACPICGMKLLKVSKPKPDATAKEKPPRQVLFYRSPMNAKQTSPSPQKDEMGMDYVPVYADEVSAPVTAELAAVEIDAAQQQLIGLKTEEATEGPVGGAWRTAGRVAIDETRVRHINLKVPGFVERVYVDFVGKQVKRGDSLFSIYSPDLLAAQEEYLLALKTSGALSKAGGSASSDGDDLVAAARRKLSLWDVPEAEIKRLAKTGKPTKNLTLYSPIAGVVTKKDVVEGMKLDAGAMPYEMVDLSSVWVLADVYESELRFVKPHMAATMALAAFPNRAFNGNVVFVDPLMDPQTRTIKVRLMFANPIGELVPEMFGEVILLGAPHDALRIPTDAVIDSGTQKIVFVALGSGKFQPRQVTLGASNGAHVEVLSGLTKGERVVTRANFLVDSESRLRASLTQGPSARAATAPESARVLSPTAVTP